MELIIKFLIWHFLSSPLENKLLNFSSGIYYLLREQHVADFFPQGWIPIAEENEKR